MSEKEKKALAESTPEPVKTVVPDADTVEDSPKEPVKPPAKKRVVRNPKGAV